MRHPRAGRNTHLKKQPRAGQDTQHVWRYLDIITRYFVFHKGLFTSLLYWCPFSLRQDKFKTVNTTVESHTIGLLSIPIDKYETFEDHTCSSQKTQNIIFVDNLDIFRTRQDASSSSPCSRQSSAQCCHVSNAPVATSARCNCNWRQRLLISFRVSRECRHKYKDSSWAVDCVKVSLVIPNK